MHPACVASAVSSSLPRPPAGAPAPMVKSLLRPPVIWKPLVPSGTPSPTYHLRNALSSNLRTSSSSLRSESTIGTPCCSRTFTYRSSGWNVLEVIEAMGSPLQNVSQTVRCNVLAGSLAMTGWVT